MESNDIKIAFDHDSAVLFSDRPFGFVETKEGFAFVKKFSFGGVEIFGLFVTEGPSTKADDAALDIEDGNHEAIAETVIVAAVALAGNDESGFFNKVYGVSFLVYEVAVEGLPSGGGIADLEALDGGIVEVAIVFDVLEGVAALGLVEGVFEEASGDS